MTFDSAKCRDIDRGNINLLQRLSSIHNRKSTNGGYTGKSKRGGASKKGSASINMRRKQNKIAMENRKFAQRLQSVTQHKKLVQEKFAETRSSVQKVRGAGTRSAREKNVKAGTSPAGAGTEGGSVKTDGNKVS